MIRSMRLKFGRAADVPPETIPIGPITVFVGPNNSGKSKALREIYQFCRTGSKDATAVILDELQFTGLAPTAIDAALDHLKVQPSPGEAVHVDHTLIGGRGERGQVPTTQLRQAVENPSRDLGTFCNWFLRFSTLMLDGSGRIGLAQPQAAGDLLQPPGSSLQVLFRDDARRKEVRRIIHEAFGDYFVIDPSALGQFRIRLSQTAPSSDIEERGIHKEAIAFHAAAQPIDMASDGVKAFTGIVTEVLAGDPRIVLIDEPEAFLHPALSYKLGSELARAAVASDKRVFVSTHSPTFVMGCLQSGASVNIVRLTYRAGTATARVLPSDDILKLMRNPLLRSTNVLSGMFYEFVVVTESDADRAFYQEINDRLLRWKTTWGIPNALFLNAQNKQTVPTIVKPLRDLGIPAAGIVDVDVLKEGGTVWTNLLASAFVPSIAHQALGTIRSAIKNAMDATGKDMKRDGGLAILQTADLEAANNLIEQLGEYGVFVVPGGELESWLTSLGASGHGPSWLIDIFQKMGEDIDSPAYVKPAESDVWKFVSKLKLWLENSHRKGIPV